MRTRKQAGILCGAIGLLIGSLVLLDWTVMLFLCPLIVVLFLAALWPASGEVAVSASHQISHSNIFEGSTIQVTCTVKNTGGKIRFLELYDDLPDRVMVQKGSNYAVLSLDEGEEVQFSYELSCPVRGLFQIGPLHVRERDFFGLVYRETVLEDAVELTVVPRLEKIQDITVRSRVNPYPGIMKTHRAGVATEFHGVRAYTPGDSFKHINWKAFARWNAPMVNEYELESTTDVILILDGREISEQSGSVKENPLEYGIRAAVILASHFLKRRDRVGLIVYGASERELTWVYPESGNTQLYKVIRGLVQTKATGEFTFQATINTAVGHLLPKKALIVFISSLEQDGSILSAVESLQAQNYSILVLSPSPLDIEVASHQNDPEYSLAKKILALRRNTVLAQLRMTGARVVDWNPVVLPLALALKEVEQYQIRR